MRSLSSYWILVIAMLALAVSPARAQWTPPVRISFNLGLLDPRAVAVGDTLHVVAYSGRGIYYLRSSDNGYSWTDPVCPADTFYGSEQIDIIHSGGALHILFEAYHSGGRAQLFHSLSTDGGRSWGTPHQLFQNSDPYLQYPRLAGRGDTLFASCSTSEWRLVLTSLNGGLAWGDSVQVDGSSRGQPATILYADGRLHLIYQGNFPDDSLGFDIYTRYSDNCGQTWSERTVLSTGDQWDSQAPSASADSAGNIIALWNDYKYGSLCGITGDILGRVSTDNGESWLPETRLTQTQGGLSSTCSMVGGNLYAVWSDYAFFGCQCPKLGYSESSDWGSSWRQPEMISGPTQTQEFSPFLFYNWQDGQPVFHCVMFKELPDFSYDLFYLTNSGFVEVDEPEIPKPEAAFLTAYPNPFNSTTMVTFNNLEGDDTEIEIFNLLGQRVRSFTIEGAKERRIIWDAMDALGNKVSSGIYFARAGTPHNSNTLKLIYLK